MLLSLAGRTALVTGGSRGLGFATARRFREAGADVAIVARRTDVLDAAVRELKLAPGGEIIGVRCDVSAAHDIAAAYQTVMSRLGRIDILMNNAGASKTMPFLEIADEDWAADFDLKLFAAIRWTRLVWPQMKQRRWGRVLNVLNTGAKAPPPASAPTTVTRAAGLALTKVMAGEGAAHNILVNALMVGYIVSDQIVAAHLCAADPRPIADRIAALGEEIPLRRMGEADEFARVATFFASDAASYVTGSALNVDGGDCPIP